MADDTRRSDARTDGMVYRMFKHQEGKIGRQFMVTVVQMVRTRVEKSIRGRRFKSCQLSMFMEIAAWIVRHPYMPKDSPYTSCGSVTESSNT
jgi:hypothetical protein